MEIPRVVFKSSLFQFLHRLEDLEREGVKLATMPSEQRTSCNLDLLASLVPWRDQLLPLPQREAICAQIMRFATRYGPVWNEMLTEFLVNQIGRAGVERWIEDHAPNWVVVTADDGAVREVKALVVPDTWVVYERTLFVPVRDASRVVSEN